VIRAVRPYIVRRLLFVLPTLLAVYTITFAIMHATPGGPWGRGDKPLQPQALANLNARYHLNDPLWKQYVSYLGNAVHGDLGPSYADRSRDVSDIIGDFLPVSLQLGAVAAILGFATGIPLGVIAAVKQNTWIDYLATFAATAGVATPSYVMVTVLIFVLALTLHLVPTGGWDGIASPRAVIPALALAAAPAAALARYARSSALDVLRQDYVRTARAKGLHPAMVMRRHVLRNALNPVLTIAGIVIADLITGSFFVETVAGVPGIGRYFVTAASGRDYPVLMALTLLYALAIVLANLAVDVGYGLLDPRVSFA
jgi:oligopeptide transport system permease protein